MSTTVLFTYYHLVILFCIQFDMPWFVQMALYNFAIFGQRRGESQSYKCETLGLVTGALGAGLETCALTFTVMLDHEHPQSRFRECVF